jgi:hypothetical protein
MFWTYADDDNAIVRKHKNAKKVTQALLDASMDLTAAADAEKTNAGHTRSGRPVSFSCAGRLKRGGRIN